MWPRFIEVAIGFWVAVSPWLLSDLRPITAWHMNELIGGISIVAFSGLSFWASLRRAHLAQIPIAIWILGSNYLGSSHPASPLIQSDILAALFLLNFAIIPSQANLPPYSLRSVSDESPRR